MYAGPDSSSTLLRILPTSVSAPLDGAPLRRARGGDGRLWIQFRFFYHRYSLRTPHRAHSFPQGTVHGSGWVPVTTMGGFAALMIGECRRVAGFGHPMPPVGFAASWLYLAKQAAFGPHDWRSISWGGKRYHQHSASGWWQEERPSTVFWWWKSFSGWWQSCRYDMCTRDTPPSVFRLGRRPEVDS